MIRSFSEAYDTHKAQALRDRASIPALEARIEAGEVDLLDIVRELREDRTWVNYLLSILPFLKAHTTALVGLPQSENNNDSTTKTVHPDGLIANTQVVDVECVTHRGTVFAEYLRTVENVDPCAPTIVSHTDLLARCKDCGHDTLIIIDRDAIRVCGECGLVEEGYQREESNCFSYKEESEQMSRNVQFAYKRANHFTDWLNAFESGSTHHAGSVPDCVVSTIRYELKKLRILNVETITPDLVRQLLKKNHLSKYYEYTNAIAAEISGRAPLQLAPELKQRLCIMFGQLQTPFELYKPKHRKNFLSYSYVIYKCLQLLGEDQLLQYFSLLKSREKLKVQDAIWKQICQHLKWQFIACV